MFLAELAFNTVAKEIDGLDEKQIKRSEALEKSKKELENDHKDLL